MHLTTILKTLTLLLIILIQTPCAHPATLTVKKDGTGDHQTIQNAIDAATHGDTIIVHPGTYFERININGKNITLQSTHPTSPTIVAQTIIDAEQQSSVITFAGTEGTTCTLSGLTITNGDASANPSEQGFNGNGINGRGTKATIQYNQIIENSMSSTIENTVQGGGISQCHGLIQHNKISKNSAESGGAFSGCKGPIKNNLIYFNTAYGLSDLIPFLGQPTGTGGAMHFCSGLKINNLIYGNTANKIDGGLSRCQGQNYNNIIWANTDPSGNTQISSDSTTPTYSCIENWNGSGTGNISQNPRLENPGAENFRLLPDSPCIDTGSTTTLANDITGTPRPIDGDANGTGNTGDGSDIDIGAHEFDPLPIEIRYYLLGHPSIILPHPPPDQNNDNTINLSDILHPQ